jgi:hypothetical protein
MLRDAMRICVLRKAADRCYCLFSTLFAKDRLMGIRKGLIACSPCAGCVGVLAALLHFVVASENTHGLWRPIDQEQLATRWVGQQRPYCCVWATFQSCDPGCVPNGSQLKCPQAGTVTDGTCGLTLSGGSNADCTNSPENYCNTGDINSNVDQCTWTGTVVSCTDQSQHKCGIQPYVARNAEGAPPDDVTNCEAPTVICSSGQPSSPCD